VATATIFCQFFKDEKPIMGSQLRIVGTFNYVDGKFVSIDTNRQDFNQGKAIPIPVDQIQKHYPLKAHSSITVGGLLNNLTLKSLERLIERYLSRPL